MRQLLLTMLCVFATSAFAVENNINKNALPGTVALTFDDGPAPVYTKQVLAILKKYHIKATFFVVGANARKYPELLKAIYADGHHVDSHSMTHPMLTKLSATKLKYEIQQPVIIIEDTIGIKPKCLRYPFGASNQQVRSMISANGMTPVPMGFNSFDYERPGAKKIADWVIKNAHSGQVILLHDGYDKREQTVAALPVIIEGIQKKGLGFSTIC